MVATYRPVWLKKKKKRRLTSGHQLSIAPIFFINHYFDTFHWCTTLAGLMFDSRFPLFTFNNIILYPEHLYERSCASPGHTFWTSVKPCIFEVFWKTSDELETWWILLLHCDLVLWIWFFQVIHKRLQSNSCASSHSLEKHCSALHHTSTAQYQY